MIALVYKERYGTAILRWRMLKKIMFDEKESGGRDMNAKQKSEKDKQKGYNEGKIKRRRGVSYLLRGVGGDLCARLRCVPCVASPALRSPALLRAYCDTTTSHQQAAHQY